MASPIFSLYSPLLHRDSLWFLLSIIRIVFSFGLQKYLQIWICFCCWNKTTFSQITGSINELGTLANPIFTVLLAYNRFIQMIFSEYADDVFSRMNTKVSECRFLNQKQYYKSQKLSGEFREENGTEKLFSESFVIYSIFYVQIYIVMCWLLAAPLPILCATPYIMKQFDPIVGEWTLNGNFSNNIIFNRIDNYTNFVLFGSLILSMIIYALIIGYLIYQVYTNFYQKFINFYII